VGPSTSVNPPYRAATVTMIGNPPPAPQTGGTAKGQSIAQGGAGFGGGFTSSPQIDVGSTIWSSNNGVPVDPETGQFAEIRPGPYGSRQHFNQSTRRW
jgi:hypothetical protein